MKNIFQKKSLIFSVIFFILSCLVFVFLYRIVINNKESSALSQEKWQTETIQRENVKSLVSSVQAIENERNLLENHFIKSSDVVPFLNAIEKMANDVGTKSEVLSVGIDKDNTSFLVEMNASGSFENIYKLVTLLENSQYDIEFVSVNIQNSNVDKKEWTADFQIRLLSFVN